MARRKRKKKKLSLGEEKFFDVTAFRDIWEEHPKGFPVPVVYRRVPEKPRHREHKAIVLFREKQYDEAAAVLVPHHVTIEGRYVLACMYGLGLGVGQDPRRCRSMLRALIVNQGYLPAVYTFLEMNDTPDRSAEVLQEALDHCQRLPSFESREPVREMIERVRGYRNEVRKREKAARERMRGIQVWDAPENRDGTRIRRQREDVEK